MPFGCLHGTFGTREIGFFFKCSFFRCCCIDKDKIVDNVLEAEAREFKGSSYSKLDRELEVVIKGCLLPNTSRGIVFFFSQPG